MLLPFAVVAVDLFARCRRRRIPVLPALRAYRSRLGFWLWVGLMFLFLGFVGVWPDGAARPARPRDERGDALAAARDRAVRPRSPRPDGSSRVPASPRGDRRPRRRRLAGHTAAMLALGVVALLVVATNPFALLFLLPSLHIWLWLPQMREPQAGGTARTARSRPDRPVHPGRVVHVPLRARSRCPLVPCGTRRDQLRLDCGLLPRPLLAGRGVTADRDRARPVRAVSVGVRAAAARADPQHRARDRARRPGPPALPRADDKAAEA